MNQAAEGEYQRMRAGRPVSVSAAFEGTETIGQARDQARSFLADLRHTHGLTVSETATDLVELVVSELVTNTRKYAPGPYLLSLELRDGLVEVSVWDSNPSLPSISPPDPYRVGRHGLEIVMATAQSFRIQRETVGKSITASVSLTDPSDRDSDHRS
ncbi:ATP-binding protein [Streptomyces sp. NPDC006512]|uniref:ATP-binding protein n=1 Tax=Streptomyces sp. NPDC006512 TaxID=3154307 RepID=UPI0033B03BA1